MVVQQRGMTWDELKKETETLEFLIRRIANFSSEDIKNINIFIAGMEMQKVIDQNAST